VWLAPSKRRLVRAHVGTPNQTRDRTHESQKSDHSRGRQAVNFCQKGPGPFATVIAPCGLSGSGLLKLTGGSELLLASTAAAALEARSVGRHTDRRLHRRRVIGGSGISSPMASAAPDTSSAESGESKYPMSLRSMRSFFWDAPLRGIAAPAACSSESGDRSG